MITEAAFAHEQLASDAISGVILCELNQLQFAVPLGAVVQAIVRPSDMMLMPRRDSALAGILTHRGQVLPLLDIRRWLPWPGDLQAEPAQVLLLQQDTMRFAIVIDAVLGLHRINETQIQRLHQANDESELFHSAVRFTQKKVAEQSVGLLDVRALAKLTQVWAADSMPDAQEADSAALITSERQALGSSVPHALFIIAKKIIGIESQYVAAVISKPEIKRVLGSDISWLGMAQWRGRDIPVLDTMSAIGLTNLSGMALVPDGVSDNAMKAVAETELPTLLVIVMHQGCCVGLPVHAVHSVMRLDTSLAQTAASAGLPVNQVLSAVQILPEEESVFLVNGDALVDSCPMSVLSQTDHMIKKESGHAHAHVIVTAGQVWAISMHWLQAIIALPEQIDPAGAAYPGQKGTFVWKLRTLPLLDLAEMAGGNTTQIDQECRVVIMRVNDIEIGLLVTQLQMILPARTGELSTLSRAGNHRLDIITIRQDQQLRSYGVLDPAHWPPLQSIIKTMQAALVPA